jgi:hypothetical protein
MLQRLPGGTKRYGQPTQIGLPLISFGGFSSTVRPRSSTAQRYQDRSKPNRKSMLSMMSGNIKVIVARGGVAGIPPWFTADHLRFDRLAYMAACIFKGIERVADSVLAFPLQAAGAVTAGACIPLAVSRIAVM